jgi:hypothetical protein
MYTMDWIWVLSGVLWGWVDVKIQRIMEKKDEYYNKGHG